MFIVKPLEQTCSGHLSKVTVLSVFEVVEEIFDELGLLVIEVPWTYSECL